MKKNPIILATQDFSGLGFAKLIKSQGDEVIIATKMKEDEEKKEEFELVGEGLYEKIPLKKAIKKYGNKNYDWVVDQNHNSETFDRLRKKGVPVLGGDGLSGDMEHERGYCSKIATRYGPPPPPTTEHKNIEDGLKLLDANQDKAYVYKPDASELAWQTFVPTSDRPEVANRELADYLESMEENPGSFILQEKKDGVEANFEVWFYEGKPFFAFCSLENKRKIAGDSINDKDPGDNIGCAQDLNFIVPLDCRGVKETIGRMFPFYKAMKFTGFADVNVIVSDRECWFLEVCNRFGYNSHPNLFYNLANDSFRNLVHDFLHGNIKDFESRWKYGFGASVSLYTDHPRKGLPIYIPDEEWKHFYPYDLLKLDDKYLLAGYDENVGISTFHEYTIKDAAEGAIRSLHRINFPGKSYRADLHKDDYPSAVSKRYEALKAMKYI